MGWVGVEPRDGLTGDEMKPRYGLKPRGEVICSREVYWVEVEPRQVAGCVEAEGCNVMARTELKPRFELERDGAEKRVEAR